MAAIVRNIQNNDLYEYLGENEFKNIRTRNSGVTTDEIAQRVFKINVEATLMITHYPQVAELISALNLKIEKQHHDTKEKSDNVEQGVPEPVS